MTVTVFAGPSLPGSSLPPSVDLRPPASRRDLQRLTREDVSTVVLVDGTFLQQPGPTHYDLLHLLRAGVRLIGASSMGALRAAELRHRGMIGIGTVYHAVIRGLITDDAELALAMCPFTYRAVSIPLVNIRAVLFAARDRGLPSVAATAAFCSASQIHFLERTPACLARAWRAVLPDYSRLLLSLLEDPSHDVKAADTRLAIQYAVDSLQRASSVTMNGRSAPDPLPLWSGQDG